MITTMRPASVVCDPVDMGGARSTRHSFSRQLIRELGSGRWSFNRALFDLDDLGRGTAAYEIQIDGSQVMTMVLFSQIIGEDARTDRVIAEAWDVTGALLEGRRTGADIEDLRSQVTVQEEGRAVPGTIIWGRANRSVRFFDQVVRDLANGQQPDPDGFGLSPYLLRSTAFYSNGKFGMRDFESYLPGHVFSTPYRAHMLAAWLFREFSCELAEHCAKAISPAAAALSGEWSRYFGLGNATGLGLVPYAVNHPEILNAWLWTREYPLAWALEREDGPDSEAASRVRDLLERFSIYLHQQGDDTTEPFTSGSALATAMRPLRVLAGEYVSNGTMHGVRVDAPWRTLHAAAEEIGPEVRGIVASVLTELTSDLDAEVESGLVCVEDRHVDPTWTVSRLRERINDDYGWIDSFDFTDESELDRFWFTSQTSEEPRRGDSAVDRGLAFQHGVNIAEQVWRLRSAVAELPDEMLVAEFLLSVPEHRAAVARVQKVGPLTYGEVRANLRSASFVPLNPQRLQLSVYGMENFNPQSTDWLRVTLFSGAPRLSEINSGESTDDWMFPLRPKSEITV